MVRTGARFGGVAVGCALLLTIGVGAAAAQNINVNMNSVVEPVGQQAADQRVVDDALADMRRGGFAALETHLSALQDVLAHAPASFPVIQTVGDQMIIRVDSSDDYMILSLMAAAMAVKGDGKAKDAKTQLDVRRGVDTYPEAALLLGSYLNEVKRPREALPYVEHGLAMQPNNFGLLIEKGSTLMALGRAADAVALYDGAIDGSDIVLIGKRARFLRNRGVALIELNRLDEAETSLKESIKADKADKLGAARAKQELDYIKTLRKGGRAVPVELETRTQAEAATKQAAPK